MWQHNYTPVMDSLAWSTVAAAIPIFVLLLLIGVLRKPAWVAGVAGLAAALIVAIGIYGMPTGLAVSSATNGAAFGLLPIGWIVYWAVVLYRLALETGNFEIIKDSIGGLTTDRRLQAMLIAFAFGAFIEGAAGFGTPVAVAAGMLMGLGFSPFYAAGICLLANTAPVAFGSIGVPVVTLAGTTGLPELELSAWVGRLCAPISLFIPAYLILVMGGFKGLKGVLPAAIVCGVCFASVQFLVSNFVGPQLVDIMASLTAIVGLVLLFKVWQPKDTFVMPGEHQSAVALKSYGFSRTMLAWSPYLFLVLFVLIWGYPKTKAILESVSIPIQWPGLHNQIMRGAPVVATPTPYAAVFNFNWLAAAGTACALASMATAARAARVDRDLPRVAREGREADGLLAAYDRVRPRPRLRDELQRRYGDARRSVREDRVPLPVLQRAARLARRVPHRQRHVGERFVRQPAGRDCEQPRARPRDDGGIELRRRRDGQDDQPHELGRRGGRDGHGAQRGRQAVPLHREAQRVPRLDARNHGDDLRLLRVTCDGSAGFSGASRETRDRSSQRGRSRSR